MEEEEVGEVIQSSPGQFSKVETQDRLFTRSDKTDFTFRERLGFP